MLYLYILLTLSLVVLLFAAIVEQRRHTAHLDQIPVRILVNGIRGKSSITRLTAGALRGGGRRVVAKTTGTAARLIWPDATEEDVYRKFDIPNVVEQISIVRRAAAESPDALVVECMAVAPALQEVNQKKLIRSTIGVLCNVREDHLTEMGPTLEDVARSLSRSMPDDGVCVTAESEWFSVLKEEADRRRCSLVYADPESVTDAEIGRFRHMTFKENVAIALEVAAQLGISREAALRGMLEAPPDPGALTVETYELGSKTVRLANMFAANDPNSTLMNFRLLFDAELIRPPMFTIINCRPDRVERNGQMGAIVPELLTEKLFVIGHPSRSAIATVPRSWGGKLIDLGGRAKAPDVLLGSIVSEIDREASLLAVGNIHGQGELLLEHLGGIGAVR